jgi:hypothetical protein
VFSLTRPSTHPRIGQESPKTGPRSPLTHRATPQPFLAPQGAKINSLLGAGRPLAGPRLLALNAVRPKCRPFADTSRASPSVIDMFP